MLRSPLQRLKNEHVECSLQQLNPVFILVFLVHRCRHSTRRGSRLSTPASWRRLHSKAVLIATPQMRSESGLTFRSKQSAVWPADPRGRRGGCEPAGKTCYLPRFHIMHTNLQALKDLIEEGL